MDAQTFYRRVAERIGEGGPEAARKGTGAVLQTLRDRLTPREADQVAAQLPVPLKAVWTAGERVDREPAKLHRPEFLDRVRREAGLATDLSGEGIRT